MKKTIALIAFTVLLAGAAFAQDSTLSNPTTKQHQMTHKKTMHNKMAVDSVNAGKITTNPHGKTDTNQPSATMKMHKKSMNTSRGSSKDSAK